MLIVVVGLIILFFVSLTLFIRRLLRNSTHTKRSQMASEARLRNIESQLDAITKRMDKEV